MIADTSQEYSGYHSRVSTLARDGFAGGNPVPSVTARRESLSPARGSEGRFKLTGDPSHDAAVAAVAVAATAASPSDAAPAMIASSTAAAVAGTPQELQLATLAGRDGQGRSWTSQRQAETVQRLQEEHHAGQMAQTQLQHGAVDLTKLGSCRGGLAGDSLTMRIAQRRAASNFAVSKSSTRVSTNSRARGQRGLGPTVPLSLSPARRRS